VPADWPAAASISGAMTAIRTLRIVYYSIAVGIPAMLFSHVLFPAPFRGPHPAFQPFRGPSDGPPPFLYRRRSAAPPRYRRVPGAFDRRVRRVR